MSLLQTEKRLHYKPFKYPWAYEAFKKQSQMHWIVDEIPFSEDIRDWKFKLTGSERNLITQILRFFTTADVSVADGYISHFMPIFNKHPELSMMMTSFAGMEAIHIDAYSTLIDTLGLPEKEYGAFAQYEEMKAKYDYLDSIQITEYDMEPGQIDTDRIKDIAKALAVYSAFTEGLQLFSSFAILLNFPRFGKLKSVGQVVTFSIKDETLHVESMIKLFNTLIKENKYIWTDSFKAELYQACRDMVDLEDKFIDLAFAQGDIEGLTAEEVKLYIRYIADRRLLQLGLKTNYKVKNNPLPWIDDMLNLKEHANFFEQRATEYSKGALTGSWDDVWAKI